MFGTTPSFSNLFSGSLVSFRHRAHPEADSEAFKELQNKKERTIGDGIDCLRRLRSEIFAAADIENQQSFLKSAFQLADQIADYCLADAFDRAAALGDHTLHHEVATSRLSLLAAEPLSKRHVVPSWVAKHLRSAAQDLLIRTEEKVESLTLPTRRLNDNEMQDVFREFAIGTNDLTINARKMLCDGTAKIAGVLSGGLVYALMAKKVAERYGAESGFEMDVIAVAVNTDIKRGIFQRSPSDHEIRNVIIVDDVIDTGGSILCAANAAEDVFIAADIYCGKSTSYARSRIPPSQQKHVAHLENVFQDFCELTEEAKLGEAKEMFITALSYAEANNVKLQRGWYARALRTIPDAASFIGAIPEEYGLNGTVTSR